MTDVTRHPRRRPSDLERDDAFLDALGRGEVPAGDEVALMLAAWREDLAGPGGPERAGTPLRTAAPAPGADVPDIAVAHGSGRRRPGRPSKLRLAIAAAAVALAAGGTAAAAVNTTPGSPLWPITRLLYPQRADRIAAEETLARARQAVKEGHRDDARRLLDEADTLIARVDDPADRARLRAELTQVRTLLSALAGVVPPGPGAAPSNGPAGGPASGPAPTSTPASTPGPLSPSLIPPSLLPTSILPGLPLPTLPPLPGVGG